MEISNFFRKFLPFWLWNPPPQQKFLNLLWSKNIFLEKSYLQKILLDNTLFFNTNQPASLCQQQLRPQSETFLLVVWWEKHVMFASGPVLCGQRLCIPSQKLDHRGLHTSSPVPCVPPCTCYGPQWGLPEHRPKSKLQIEKYLQPHLETVGSGSNFSWIGSEGGDRQI